MERDTHDLDLIPWLICLLVHLDTLNHGDCVHATHHTAEHRVLAIEPWSGHGCDEELRPASYCHTFAFAGSRLK